MSRKLVGHVGVDSGQMMLADPCYVTDNAFVDNPSGLTEKDVKQPNGGYGLSYQGACAATLSEEQAGMLNFHAGHNGAAVVCSTGYGDGVYPVYVEYSDEGEWGTRVKSMTIEFIGDDE